MRPDPHFVIVGGGVIGIFSALFLAKFGHQVTIIEQSQELGGLHCTDTVGAYEFDRGTHVPSLTGVKEIDQLMFGKLGNYVCFNSIVTGNFFKKKWNDHSSLIDGRVLPKEVYLQALYEIFHNASSTFDKGKNLKEHIIDHFGKTLFDEVFCQVLNKLCDYPIEQLSSATLGLYGINRLILFSPEKTFALKKSEYFDEIIGFHDGNLRELPFPIVYPKSDRGIAFWIDELVTSLKQYNVKLVTDRTVEKISRQGENIRTISLSGGETLDLDFLVWTIPPSIALKAARKEFSSPKLNFRTTTLFHFIFPESSIKKKQMYLWVWDKDFKTLRITLYNNIYNNRFNGESGLTVECLTSFEEAQGIDARKILFELAGLGVIENIPPTVVRKIVLPNTFPIISQDYELDVGKVAREFENAFANACLVGKGSGKYWFTRDLLVHAFGKLSPLIKSSGS